MDDLITAAELAARWGCTEQALANRRYYGNGPEFVKVGRRPLYPLRAVERFERQHTYRRTRERAS